MSRWLPWLAELQPEMFAEIDPVLAAKEGIEDGGWMTISSPRGRDRGPRAVTPRMRPLQIDRATIHQIGLPWHWGAGGAGDRRRGQRPDPALGRSEHLDPRVQGVRLQRPRRPRVPRDDQARRRPRQSRPAWPPTATIRRRPTSTNDRALDHPPRRSAHGLLHRHDRVHRLQGVRGGLQAVERPAVRRRHVPQGRLLRQHGHAGRRHLASRALRRARRRRRRRHRGGRRISSPGPRSAIRARRPGARAATPTGSSTSTTSARGSSCPTSASTAPTPAAWTRARPAR